MITLDDVVTEEEAQRLIELGGIEGYERSRDVGKRKADGTHERIESKARTSENAWCASNQSSNIMPSSPYAQHFSTFFIARSKRML